MFEFDNKISYEYGSNITVVINDNELQPVYDTET